MTWKELVPDLHQYDFTSGNLAHTQAVMPANAGIQAHTAGWSIFLRNPFR